VSNRFLTERSPESQDRPPTVGEDGRATQANWRTL
jgi:hypothetical protein